MQTKGDPIRGVIRVGVGVGVRVGVTCVGSVKHQMRIKTQTHHDVAQMIRCGANSLDLISLVMGLDPEEDDVCNT